MSRENGLAIYAHLMRRAGFGATHGELESFAAQGYEAVVDDLVNPERLPDVDEDLINRFHRVSFEGKWLYRMVNTRRPLVEKMALFWHHLLATGSSKSNHHCTAFDQILMFRDLGLSDVRTVMTAVSKDPAMIFWLDNQENLEEEPNENYGRELMELFSMGVGNYTEDDVKAATQAFTGWSVVSIIPGSTPYGKYPTSFDYVRSQHDDENKSYLGETGRFNGEDIIDIIVQQPATARFIARQLYTFFVADEPAVATWNEVPPQDPDAIDTLAQAYLESEGDMRTMLQVLFNSDFFKDARFKRVKSPTELVTGVMKLTGSARTLRPGIGQYAQAASVMGQNLTRHLTVEGWPTGQGWIDGGTLNERVNFAVDEVADAKQQGIQELIGGLTSLGDSLTPEGFVEGCLDLAGQLEVSEDTREGLMQYAESGSELRLGVAADREESEARVSKMLQLIVAAREYQFN